MRTKLAVLIGTEEGFFTAGTLPRRNHNPGDLRHSPHSTHQPAAPDAIGVIDTDEHGWADLERQLALYASRLITLDPRTLTPCPSRWMTLQDAIYTWAPPGDNNNSAKYLEDVLAGFAADLVYGEPVVATTPLIDVLTIAAQPAVTT